MGQRRLMCYFDLGRSELTGTPGPILHRREFSTNLRDIRALKTASDLHYVDGEYSIHPLVRGILIQIG